MAPRSVLAIGDNRFPFHWFEARGSEIAAAFDGRIDVILTTDKDDLVDLSGYDAVIDYYDRLRSHQALDDRTPADEGLN